MVLIFIPLSCLSVSLSFVYRYFLVAVIFLSACYVSLGLWNSEHGLPSSS